VENNNRVDSRNSAVDTNKKHEYKSSLALNSTYSLLYKQLYYIYLFCILVEGDDKWCEVGGWF